jgi:NAD-dependent deacetylase
MQKIVVLTGSGISAESGIKTFRDADGLWNGHDVTKVASPAAWRTNPALVLEFYNQRRKQCLEVEPNPAHYALARLERAFEVTIVTQNVDNLHERAGSTNVVHLHGELLKSRSTADESIVQEMRGWELKLGDLCPLGSQLRPHIVWFGEDVTEIGHAAEVVAEADYFLVVGTSLVVYPAAGLLDYVRRGTEIWVIDPNLPYIRSRPGLHCLEEKATTGVRKVVDELLTRV